MHRVWDKYGWIAATIVGSAVFALGFSMFLEPNDMSAGGISGLAMVFVKIFGIGTVGSLSILINLPLFILGGLKIGRRFFAGSLLGMLLSSVMIDSFTCFAIPNLEPLLAVLYGGVICGLSRPMAMECAAQMLVGIGKLYLETGKHPGQLKDEVCSPGGATIEGIRTLEENGFRGAAIDAVVAAWKKSSKMK